MKTGIKAGLVFAGIALSSVNASAQAEQEQEMSLWSAPAAFLQEHARSTSDMVQRLFGSMLQHATSPVQVLVIEDEEPVVVNEGDRSLACSAAVRELKTRQKEREQAAELARSLRLPSNAVLRVVGMRFGDQSECESLLHPKLITECNRYVAKLTKVGTELNDFNSEEDVCAKLMKKEKNIAEPPKSVASPSLSCTLCKRFVQMVDNALQQDLEKVQEVREIIGDICDSMSAESRCHVFLKRYDDIVEWLRHGSDPEVICEEIRMCLAPSTGERVAEKPENLTKHDIEPVQNDHACFYCTEITSVIRFVHDHSSDQMQNLKTVLKYVCKITPKDCRCDDMEKKFDHIVDLLKQGKEPRQVCEDIGMCKKSVTAGIGNSTALVTALSNLILTSNQTSEHEDKCFYCDYFTTMVEVIVQEDPDQIDQIREFADLICQILGDKNKCHAYVSKLDFVLDELKKGKHPREICIKMGYCTSLESKSAVAVPGDSRIIESLKQTLNRSVDQCFLCMEITTVVRLAVSESPERVEEVKQILDMVCGLTEKVKCRSFAKKFDDIVDMIRNGADNHTICQKIGSCKKEAKSTAAKTDEIGKCAYCDGVVTVLEIALKQKPDDVNEMREAAGIVCDLLPEDDQCHADLKLFDQVVNMLKSGKSSHEICRALKFCGDELKNGKLSLSIFKDIDPSIKPSRCTTCQQNTLLMSSLAVSPESLELFEKKINSVCRLVPQAPECQLLRKHFFSLRSGIEGGENVNSLCERIGECPSSVADLKKVKSMSVCCLFCSYMAELVDKMKHEETELRMAKEALGTMCSILPPNFKCDMLLSKFDRLVSLVRSGQTPSEACAKLEMCEALELTALEKVTEDKSALPTPMTELTSVA